MNIQSFKHHSHRWACVAILTAACISARAQVPSWAIGPFTRPADKPIIAPDHDSTFLDPVSNGLVHWETLHTFNPGAALAPDGQVAILYRAEDDTGKMRVGGHTSRLGLATSADGLQMHRLPAPVFYMDHDSQAVNEIPGGVEDPRIVQTRAGLYVMTYTQYARERHIHTAGIATSRDLKHWTKYGPIFQNAGPAFQNFSYKSAAILTELHGDRLVAVKLHGKYWMYWGEGTIGLASSKDLIHWTPVTNPLTQKSLVLLEPRPGHFDSGFPEAGPPPVLTKDGIVLLYNAKNSPPGAEVKGDPELAPGTYSVGEALFSPTDPTKMLERLEKPIFQPEKDFERSGQYRQGTTFAEGLVPFHGQWFLYYGCADSFVAAATAPLRP